MEPDPPMAAPCSPEEIFTVWVHLRWKAVFTPRPTRLPERAPICAQLARIGPERHGRRVVMQARTFRARPTSIARFSSFVRYLDALIRGRCQCPRGEEVTMIAHVCSCGERFLARPYQPPLAPLVVPSRALLGWFGPGKRRPGQALL